MDVLFQEGTLLSDSMYRACGACMFVLALSLFVVPLCEAQRVSLSRVRGLEVIGHSVLVASVRLVAHNVSLRVSKAQRAKGRVQRTLAERETALTPMKALTSMTVHELELWLDAAVHVHVTPGVIQREAADHPVWTFRVLNDPAFQKKFGLALASLVRRAGREPWSSDAVFELLDVIDRTKVPEPHRALLRLARSGKLVGVRAGFHDLHNKVLAALVSIGRREDLRMWKEAMKSPQYASNAFLGIARMYPLHLPSALVELFLRSLESKKMDVTFPIFWLFNTLPQEEARRALRHANSALPPPGKAKLEEALRMLSYDSSFLEENVLPTHRNKARTP